MLSWRLHGYTLFAPSSFFPTNAASSGEWEHFANPEIRKTNPLHLHYLPWQDETARISGISPVADRLYLEVSHLENEGTKLSGGLFGKNGVKAKASYLPDLDLIDPTNFVCTYIISLI